MLTRKRGWDDDGKLWNLKIFHRKKVEYILLIISLSNWKGFFMYSANICFVQLCFFIYHQVIFHLGLIINMFKDVSIYAFWVPSNFTFFKIRIFPKTCSNFRRAPKEHFSFIFRGRNVNNQIRKENEREREREVKEIIDKKTQ